MARIRLKQEILYNDHFAIADQTATSVCDPRAYASVRNGQSKLRLNFYLELTLQQ
jgi:hypothetical protein